jgi:ABC-type cobalamin transport system permease subunit
MSHVEQTKARTRRPLQNLLLAVATGAALVIVAPIFFHSILGFPLFSLRSWVTSGAVTFAFAVPAFWVVFARRPDVTARMAVAALSVLLVVVAFIAWRFH